MPVIPKLLITEAIANLLATHQRAEGGGFASASRREKEKNLQEFLIDVDLQKRSPAEGESVGLQMASFYSWKRLYLLRVSNE
jgi:hypothetical protein